MEKKKHSISLVSVILPVMLVVAVVGMMAAFSDGVVSSSPLPSAQIGPDDVLSLTVPSSLPGEVVENDLRVATKIVAANDTPDKENRAGYICDGIDDQDNINQAIADLPAGGGVVYLLEGTYVVSGEITIDKSNVTLVGAGASTVIKIKDSHNTDINVISAASKSRLLIQNLRIGGNKGQQTSGTMHGIYFTGVENSKIINCWVENLRYHGIYLDSSNNNTIMGNTVTGNGYDSGIYLSSSSNNTISGNACQGNDKYGIWLDSSSNNTVTGNICQGNGSSGIWVYDSSNYNTVTGNTCQGNDSWGIVLNSSSNNTLAGNTIAGNTGGIYMSVSDNNTVTSNTVGGNVNFGIRLHSSSNNTITGNSITGNGNYGIYLNNSCSNNTISGNTVAGNGSHGIYLKDFYSSCYNNTFTGNTCQGNSGNGIYLCADNNTITGNTCQGNDEHGIYLYSSGLGLESSSNNTVTGNTCNGNSQAAGSTYDGINIDSNSDYNNIQGNTVRRGTGANQQRYGIRIDSADCDGNLVANNDCYDGGVTAGINDVGTSTNFGAGNRNNDGTWSTTPN